MTQTDKDALADMQIATRKLAAKIRERAFQYQTGQDGRAVLLRWHSKLDALATAFALEMPD